MFQAWKLEQERLKEEEEEEEKNKTTKNQPKGKQQQEAAKPGDAKKKKGAGNVESVPEPSVEESAEAQPEEVTFSVAAAPPSRSRSVALTCGCVRRRSSA